MGAVGFNPKRGVGKLMNKRWKRKIITSGFFSERNDHNCVAVPTQKMFACTFVLYFTLGTQTVTSKRCTHAKRHSARQKNAQLSLRVNFNAQLAPGEGPETVVVGKYALDESNKRGLIIQDHVVLNTTFKKRLDKQVSMRSAVERRNSWTTC